MNSTEIGGLILDAGADGDLAKLKEVKEKVGDDIEFRRICDVISQFRTGRRVLHYAAEMGHFEICKFLIENVGVQIDVLNYREDTPLMGAAKEGHDKVVKYLINKGAQVQMSNSEGYTSLHFAVLKVINNLELVKFLLMNGAPIEAESVNGTPLHCAASRGSVETVKLLLKNGGEPNSYSSFFESPLICAIKSRSLECMELLLKGGADPNHISYGLYPLAHAAKESDTKFLKALLNAGADPNPPCPGLPKPKPIEEAAAAGNVNGVEILFPLAEPIAGYPNWSVDGIMNYSLSDQAKIKENRRAQLDTVDQKGKIAANRKNYSNAIKWYSEAIELDPLNPKWLLNRSLCFARLDKGVHALRDAEECVKLDPESGKAHYRRGAAWKLFKNYHMAAFAFRDASMCAPQNKEIWQAYRVALSEYLAWLCIYCPEEMKDFRL